MHKLVLTTKTLKDMSEHDNLQDADGDNLNATPQENSTTESSYNFSGRRAYRKNYKFGDHCKETFRNTRSA